jgi:long-chain acyl-CoA synthetase
MLFEPLFAHAKQKPQDIAVIDDSGQYTWQQLAAMAAGLGMYLGAQTQKPRVGLLLPSSAGFAASFYGTLLAGKSAVPINFLLGEREIAHIISDSGIDTIVTIPQLAARLKDVPLNIVDLTQLPKTPPAAITPKFPSPRADEMAVLIYTSGTSGLPKGVVLTYGNLQSTVSAAIEAAGLKGQHRFLGIVPLFHSLGLTATLLAPVALGATVVYVARFSPVAALNAVKQHNISVMFGIPSMYGAIANLKQMSPEDFKSVYAIISGGEPLPTPIREGFQKRTGHALYEGYGLTETCGPTSVNTPQAHRAGSVGKMLPGSSAKIVDEENKPLPAGEIGEVWLHGPNVMQGYFNLPTETQNVLTADRYFKTGDLGKIDSDGYLFITGRKKDMIIVSGEKAFPREIEEIILKHPAVMDAAVVGKKDPGRGEVVAAFVVPKEGQTIKESELRDFCRDNGLAQWKCPREVIVAAELPRSPTGKVLKRELAAKVNAPG